MKPITFFSITLILLSFGKFQYAVAQSSLDSEHAIKVIKDFYITDAVVWSSEIKPGVMKKKLDSLYKNYCTINLQQKLARDLKINGLDYNLMTKNNDIDPKSLKSLQINIDKSKANRYIVSWVYNTTGGDYKPVVAHALLYVTIEYENGNDRIASVTEKH